MCDVEAGGIVGWSDGTITNCYNTGSVSGADGIGGIAGGTSSVISNCYNAGTVNGYYGSSGVIDWNWGTITNCYYDNVKCTVGGINGSDVAGKAVGKTTSDMVIPAFATTMGAAFSATTDTCACGGNMFYPELGVFKNSADNMVKLASRLSVTACCNGQALMTVCGCSDAGYNQAAFEYGDGTISSPYEIWTVQQLNHVRAHLSSSYILMDDITIPGNFNSLANTSYGWEPIGGDYRAGFKGNFDGNNKTIMGLHSTASSDLVGLFKNVQTENENIEIKNVRLANVNINANAWGVGGVVGYSESFGSGTITISNCQASGSVVGEGAVGGIIGCAGTNTIVTDCSNASSVSENGGWEAGGIAGEVWYATITNCANIGTVSGDGGDGGIVGGVSYATIMGCYNTGAVSGTGVVGGIVGGGWGSTAVTNCYNAGTVSGIYEIGGVTGSSSIDVASCYNTGDVSGYNRIGGVAGGNGGTVKNCYSSGKLSGTVEVGGVVGWNGGTVSNCYYDNVKCTIGGINGSDITGSAVGKTTEVMVDASFAATINNGGTAFEATANCYPELSVFKNSANPVIRAASAASVSIGSGTIEPLEPQLIEFTYDLMGNITQMVDNLGATAYTYSSRGDLLTETRDGVVKTYTYDANGNRKTFSAANGATVYVPSTTYTFDLMNRLASVVADGDTTTYTYDQNSNLLTETTKTGTTVMKDATFTYNNANLLKTQTNMAKTTAIENYTRTYTANGNLATSVEPAGTKTYTYDKVGRLKTGDSKTFTYDAYSNRLSDGVLSYAYDKNNRLTTSATHDNNGNMLTYSGKTYQYDVLNRLKNANGATYTYDGNGLMQSKTVSGVTTTFIYDGANIVAEITNGVVTTYSRGVRLISVEVGTDKRYYHHNPHGDVTKLTNAAGTTLESYTYDAFGGQTSSTGATQPFRYCAEYFDVESGLIYLRARFYDPQSGRFLSEDGYEFIKLKNPLSANLYTYCYNNPIRYFDPTGHVVTDWDRNHLTNSELTRLQYITDNWFGASATQQNIWRDEAEAIRAKYRASNEATDAYGYTTTNVLKSPTATSASSIANNLLLSVKTPIGLGWWYREDPAHYNGGQPHVHVGNKKGEEWSANRDGTESHKGKNPAKDLPGWVKDKVKDDTGVTVSHTITFDDGGGVYVNGMRRPDLDYEYRYITGTYIYVVPGPVAPGALPAPGLSPGFSPGGLVPAF